MGIILYVSEEIKIMKESECKSENQEMRIESFPNYVIRKTLELIESIEKEIVEGEKDHDERAEKED